MLIDELLWTEHTPVRSARQVSLFDGLSMLTDMDFGWVDLQDLDLRLGIIYLAIIAYFGWIGAWWLQAVLGGIFLPVGVFLGITLGVFVARWLHGLDLPEKHINFGVFAVFWYLLSMGIAVVSTFWIAPVMSVDLGGYFSELILVIFGIGLLVYMLSDVPASLVERL